MRKLGALKVRGVQRKKTCFMSWKAYFSSCYFFITLFSFALQRWLLELEAPHSPNILNHSKWSRHDEDLKKWLMIE
jgi:hypothetical protein